jgi:L-phenylalanine/L-methionine N-acetyltransferase
MIASVPFTLRGKRYGPRFFPLLQLPALEPGRHRVGYTQSVRSPPSEPTSLTIRPAKVGDVDALDDLQREIYREGVAFVGDGPPSPAAMERRLRFSDARASLDLVAFRGSDLVGWLELNRHTPQKLQHVAVLTLAVAERARRTGVGRRLMQEAYAWCADVGVRKISLDVRAGNAAAIALYRSEGFELEGRERAQVRAADGFEDNLIMGKWLG